jgi:hypothetical protein
MLFENAIFEYLDLDGALRRFHYCNDIASLHLVAWLRQPFDERGGLHVGAERRHAEVGHVGAP